MEERCNTIHLQAIGQAAMNWELYKSLTAVRFHQGLGNSSHTAIDTHSICGSCGAHYGNLKYPSGVAAWVSDTPVDVKEETFPDHPRYVVKQHCVPLLDDFLNIRTLHVPNFNVHKSYPPKNDAMSGPRPDLTKVHFASFGNFYGAAWTNDRISQYDPGSNVVKNIKYTRAELIEAWRHFNKGRFLFYVLREGWATMPKQYTQFKQMAEELGVTTVYETDLFNNRTHEYEKDYLRAVLIKVE